MADSAKPIDARLAPAAGEKLPLIGVGTYQTFDVGAHAPERAELTKVLRTLAKHGGSVVDSSPMYGRAEGVVGDLAQEARLRASLFLATKVWTRGEASGIAQMEDSFRLLRTKRIDLMQVHNLVDWRTHLKTLQGWKASGRVRHIGVTHYHAGAYDELMSVIRTREFSFVQFNYSLAEREAEQRLLPLCAELGMGVIINRPFSQGGLFPRVKGKSLPPWASELGCASWAQFFLKWILGHPAVTCVIPGTRRVAHLEDNLGAGRGPFPDAAQRTRMLDHLNSL
ncbi:MAG: aldo/keto reductase [Betaproteobacteria bacterium]|nr:MAG: aldo/keto reductase [Betaproteobacteria bacterium]